MTKVVKEVAFVEKFYDIIFYVHNTLVLHSGENKTEYQIDLRYACLPEIAIKTYIQFCPICALKKCNR